MELRRQIEIKIFSLRLRHIKEGLESSQVVMIALSEEKLLEMYNKEVVPSYKAEFKNEWGAVRTYERYHREEGPLFWYEKMKDDPEMGRGIFSQWLPLEVFFDRIVGDPVYVDEVPNRAQLEAFDGGEPEKHQHITV